MVCYGQQLPKAAADTLKDVFRFQLNKTKNIKLIEEYPLPASQQIKLHVKDIAL